MPKSEQLLTTKAFSQKAGVSPSTVSTWLKKGKIKGKKEGTKWLIAIGELKKVDAPKPVKVKAAPKKKQAPSGRSFSVEAFAEMTFLTIYGVEKWLKEGRLTGGVDASGQRCVDASSLNNPHVKRLLR